MASYHDPYDSRLSSSRHDESRSRSFLTPEAALGPNYEKSRRSSQSRHSSRDHHVRSNSTRRSSSSLLPPTNDASRHRSRSRSRQRSPRPRPPTPICEDEITSLAKEAGFHLLRKDIGKDEAVLRGTVDQEPVIQDATVPRNDPSKAPSAPRPSALATPPTSDDEKAKKASRRPSRLNINLKDSSKEVVPELGGRVASPYSYSKDRGLAKDGSAPERLLSPDTLLSPPQATSHGRPQRPYSSRSQPTSPVREIPARSPKSKTGNDYFSSSSNESAVEDTDYDTSDSASNTRRRKPSTYPSARQEAPQSTQKTKVQDFAAQPGLAPPRRLHLDARRNTDTEASMPRLNVDKNRRPAPLDTAQRIPSLTGSPIYASPTAHRSTAELPVPSSRNASVSYSKNSSPVGSLSGRQRNPTPPESPRTSAEFYRNPSLNSSPASRTGSVSGSRPSSPTRTSTESARLPKTDPDWNAVLAANAARSSRQPARVTSLRQMFTPTSPRDDNGQAPLNRAASLPYPVDDGPWSPSVMMPSERHHQFFPDPKPSLQPPFAQEAKPMSRAASPLPTSATFSASRPPRPTYPPRRSVTDLSSMERPAPPEKPRATEPIRTSSFNNPSQAKKDLPVLLKKGLPSCPRAKPVAGYSDWYSLKSTSSLDFCPECISHMDRTVYRLNLRPSPPRSSEKETFCALGGDPWVRLAWQLTLARQRPDIKLLEGIAAVQDAGDCPGESSLHHYHRSATTYGIKDRDGYYIPNFSVCRADVDKLELLMPTLYGLFVPLPNRTSSTSSTSQPRKCALRTTSTRFTPYITHLTKLDTTTRRQQQSTPTDPSAFTDFVQRKTRLQECPKDAQFGPNVLWHHHPQLKEFTICEDCFDSVVEPELARGKSQLVKGFPRAKGVVYSSSSEEKGGVVIGRSCQLYGAYMRGIFAKAVEEEDFGLLAKCARKRREAELGLQEGYRKFGERLRRLEAAGGNGEDVGEEKRRLLKKLRDIRDDWSTWE